jgi:TIR domain
MAPRNILPGSSYGEAIITAIQQTHIMILVFTANANESVYVNKEVERAVSKGAIIIPMRFQDILPTKALDFFLGSEHWLDAINPPFKRHLDKLVESVRAFIETKKPQHLAPAPVNQKDVEDIKLFNELAPADWNQPSGKISKWIHNLFKDKS